MRALLPHVRIQNIMSLGSRVVQQPTQPSNFWTRLCIMIIDRIEHAHHYFGVHPHLKSALDYLAINNSDGMEDAILEGGAIKISVSEFLTKPEPECNIEAHTTVADVHFSIHGTEVIGYCERSDAQLKPDIGSNADTVYFASANMSYLKLLPGMFCVLLPQDVHCAKIMNGQPETCKKAVVKVLL